MSDEETPRTWLFLFGPNHVHPETGESLARRYVKMTGTWSETRRRMHALFGPHWSHQSDAPPIVFESVYGDVELPESEWPKGGEGSGFRVQGSSPERRSEPKPQSPNPNPSSEVSGEKEESRDG